MIVKNICLCLLLILFSLVDSKETCSDCIPWNMCPAAVELIRNRISPEKLTQAFCGYKNPYDDIAMVCCSEIDVGDDDDLEKHPNAHLLPNDCGTVDGKRILGGTDAGLYEFPWMVLITYGSPSGGVLFQCGGTLINNWYVLTAAHCIKNKRIAGVRVGEHTVGSRHDCERQGEKLVCQSYLQEELIEETAIHEDFLDSRFVKKNDIGLLRLKNPINFTCSECKNAKAVCLPLSNSLRHRKLNGVNATVAGWGSRNNEENAESNSVSGTLQKVTVPIFDKDSCKEQLKPLHTTSTRRETDDLDHSENKLCAGEKSKDACKGDSGGPLMVDGVYKNTTRVVQYGIVSYGLKICGTEVPGVYTDITKHMEWILDHIKP